MFNPFFTIEVNDYIAKEIIIYEAHFSKFKKYWESLQHQKNKKNKESSSSKSNFYVNPRRIIFSKLWSTHSGQLVLSILVNSFAIINKQLSLLLKDLFPLNLVLLWVISNKLWFKHLEFNVQSHNKQSTDLQCKSTDWFLCDCNISFKWVKKC